MSGMWMRTWDFQDKGGLHKAIEGSIRAYTVKGFGMQGFPNTGSFLRGRYCTLDCNALGGPPLCRNY